MDSFKNFSCLGKKVRFSGKVPLVLVHPFFLGSQKQSYSQSPDLRTSNEDYLTVLSRQLAFPNRNLFLLEQYIHVEETVGYIAKKRSLDGVFLVETFVGKPTPLAAPSVAPWKKVADFIRPYGSEVEFAGGYLWDHRYPNVGFSGCLGSASFYLRSRGINGKFVRGACFS